MTENLDILSETLSRSLEGLELRGTAQIEEVLGGLQITLNIFNDGISARSISQKCDELAALLMGFSDQKSFSLTLDDVPTKQGRQLAIFLQPIESLHFSDKTRNLDFFSNDLKKFLERELNTRRTNRKRSELPDPTKPADAFVNRKKSGRRQVKIEMEPANYARLDQFNQSSGRSKKEIIETALELFYQSQDPAADNDGPT